MWQTIIVLLVGLLAHGPTVQLKQPDCAADPAKKTVEDLWAMATRGEMLPDDGLAKESAYFTDPSQLPDRSSFQVVSNYFGVNDFTMNGSTATIYMEFTDEGSIDSALRYTPPPETRAYKTSRVYKLGSEPKFLVVYAPDGKTIIRKTVEPGVFVWRIEGPPERPWVTVNTAIRYVFELRNKTKDPALKKNADATLAQLITMH